MPKSGRARGERIRTDALLVRTVPFGEADAMVTLFTEQKGIVSAAARSARRSSHRFPALEPMHLLRVGIDERPGAEVATLVESSIARPRLALVASLDKLDAAGRALRWVRRAAPPHTREPVLWDEANAFLDEIDAAEESAASALIAGFGFRMLAAVGWGLELERCVRCGRPCEPGASAYLDPSEGGLVCRSCGGGPVLLRGERRERWLRAAAGDREVLGSEDIRVALEVVEATLAAHT
jgi:DNA repair protein RecO (recombination protein O)